jgi:type II secretory pathway component PulL
MPSAGGNSRRLRYSIAVLLFVALCSAGLFSGYRAGYRQGYAAGQNQRVSEQVFPKLHSIGSAMQYVTESDLGKYASGANPKADLIMEAIESFTT